MNEPKITEGQNPDADQQRQVEEGESRYSQEVLGDDFSPRQSSCWWWN